MPNNKNTNPDAVVRQLGLGLPKPVATPMTRAQRSAAQRAAIKAKEKAALYKSINATRSAVGTTKAQIAARPKADLGFDLLGEKAAGAKAKQAADEAMANLKNAVKKAGGGTTFGVTALGIGSNMGQALDDLWMMTRNSGGGGGGGVLKDTKKAL